MLGCGTVGGGVIRLIQDNAEYLASRVGAPLEIAHVLVRDAVKDRVPECRREWLTTDPEVGIRRPRGRPVRRGDGRRRAGARPISSARSAAGKGVVTANKLLLAKHGPELVEAAIAARVDLAFEASVGGGIPVIRTLREALSSDWVVERARAS